MLLLVLPIIVVASVAGDVVAAAGQSCSKLVAPGGVTVPCLDIPRCGAAVAQVSNFTVMSGGPNNGPAVPAIAAEHTSASVCWSPQGLQVNWTAVDANVVYNCSGTTQQCCHDQVWQHDALEFYMSAGLNASWNGQHHNVTEVDGGARGGFWAGFINNSGYEPTMPTKLIPCATSGLSWAPSIDSAGFAAKLHVPWSLLPGAPAASGLRGSVWRLNFYRWDHGLAGGGGNASAWSVTYCDRDKGHATGGCNGEHVPKYFGVGLLV